MAYAFDERLGSPTSDTAEDGPYSDSSAAPRRDPLSRAGSQQASPKESKNPFRSSISIRNPFRKDGSSSSVPQRPSSTKPRAPLPFRGDSSSSIPSKPQTSGLAEFFDDRAEPDAPYSDWDFQEIVRHLRAEQETWSKAPRLYTVLRLIGELQNFGKILDKGFDDYWFPFEANSVPNTLGPHSCRRFLATQDCVLTKAVTLEKIEMKEHVHFGNGDTFPFEVIEKLGRGGFATVDRVCSNFSSREYARKRFRRGKGESQKEIEDFKNELQVLKRIHHHHCVELMFSYTDSKYISLIMSPVADCDLLEFYSRVPEDDRLLNVLRTFYGCLATALRYLHDSKIRHKDIKPANILVKGESVYLADFGIALDWENRSSGTTTEDTGKSWVYCAPEMTNDQSRNESSDVYSLGCVFVEMTTVLKGRSIDEMRKSLEKFTGNYRFHRNQKGVDDWSRGLCISGSKSDNLPLTWSTLMMQVNPGKRPNAENLCAEIVRTTEDTDAGAESFYGECCLASSDTESTVSSAPGSDVWAESNHADGTTPPISPITSRVGTDRSIDAISNKEGPRVEDSPAALDSQHPCSPTIEITAFQEETSQSANPLAGLEGPTLASPPGRKKLMRFPSLLKTRGKGPVGTTQELEHGSIEGVTRILPKIAIDGEAGVETSEADTIKKDYKGVASEVSAALQAVRSRRLSSSSDISAMVKPIVAWRSRRTSDAGLGISGVEGADDVDDLQPLPMLGPQSWTTPDHLLDDVRNDSNFMSFLESYYENPSEFVSTADPKDITLLVMLLLKHGLNVESWKYVDNDGASPTFAILDWGQAYRGVLILMIRAGAKLQYETRDGDTPLTRAAARGYIWAIDILVEAGAILNSQARRVALVEAAASGQLEALKHLMANLHAIPDQKTAKRRTALRAACSKGHVAVVQYLLETFKDHVDIEARFKNQTPLFDACLRGDAGVAKILLAHGADPNGGKDIKTGNLSYLHHAARAGNTEMVQLLIESGADISARSRSLITPLDEAKKKGKTEAVFRLLEAKAEQDRMKRELQRIRR